MNNDLIDYEPVTELEALGIIEKGKYKGWIKNSESRPGKKDPSKKIVVLTIDVYDKNNKPNTMYLWCGLKHLLLHAAKSTGNLDKYEGKKLKHSDLIDKEVLVDIDIQEGTEQYPRPRNVIVDLLPISDKSKPDFDDPISF